MMSDSLPPPAVGEATKVSFPPPPSTVSMAKARLPVSVMVSSPAPKSTVTGTSAGDSHTTRMSVLREQRLSAMVNGAKSPKVYSTPDGVESTEIAMLLASGPPVTTIGPAVSTVSQSGSTWSIASTIAVSLSGPQITLSTSPSWLLRVSLPKPPSRPSLPAPPVTSSLPPTPFRKLFWASPTSLSGPGEPSRPSKSAPIAP